MTSNRIHLAFQADQNYVDGLVATLCGVRRHLPPGREVEAHVIDCGIDPITRQRLGEFMAARVPAITLSFLTLDASVLARFPFPEGLQHANRSIYARLFLPELLPQLDRILYLDCDLLVDADVSVLAELPLDGAVVAAALDEEARNPAGAPTFNSGVMVMDLRAMRASGLTRQAVDAAGIRNPRHGDQTLLNELLAGRWKPLDRRWNRQVFLLPGFSVFRSAPHALWHVYMGRKPWHFHRAGARGLVAEYHTLLTREGWVPTFVPQLRMQTSASRDQLKGALAAARRFFGRLR